MPKSVTRKPKAEAQLLNQATRSLIRAIKRHALVTGRQMTDEQLLKAGYSRRFVALFAQS